MAPPVGPLAQFAPIYSAPRRIAAAIAGRPAGRGLPASFGHICLRATRMEDRTCGCGSTSSSPAPVPGRIGIIGRAGGSTRFAAADAGFDCAPGRSGRVQAAGLRRAAPPAAAAVRARAYPRAGARASTAADAFVFVTPEYNHGPTPALVNALDFVFQEWGYKPVGVRQLRRHLGRHARGAGDQAAAAGAAAGADSGSVVVPMVASRSRTGCSPRRRRRCRERRRLQGCAMGRGAQAVAGELSRARTAANTASNISGVRRPVLVL